MSGDSFRNRKNGFTTMDGGQMPKSKEIKFYQEQGFHIDHYIMGSPCMVKSLGGDTGSEA